MGTELRFYTTHLIGLVALAAFVFAMMRHPESWWAALVPMIGGVFVVLPVLGTMELLMSRDPNQPQIGWLGMMLIGCVAAGGFLAALFVVALLSRTISR